MESGIESDPAVIIALAGGGDHAVMELLQPLGNLINDQASARLQLTAHDLRSEGLKDQRLLGHKIGSFSDHVWGGYSPQQVRKC